MTAQLQLDLDGTPDALPAALAPAPPDAVARRRIATDVEATLFVEAGAGAGKTTALVGRVAALVDGGVPIEQIAAITFTEKAAAELRHRLRSELAGGAVDDAGRARRRAALEGLDHAPIGTLHAFARRLLFEFPIEAGLPPGFGVLDELESQLAVDERWAARLDELLDDPFVEVAPALTAADLVQLCGWRQFKGMASIRRVVDDFQANWDLVAERVDAEAPPRPAIDVAPLVAAARAIGATEVPDTDTQAGIVAAIGAAGEALAGAGDLGAVLDGLDGLAKVAASGRGKGNAAAWRRLGVAARDALRDAEAELADATGELIARMRAYRQQVVGAIARQFVLEGASERAAAGTLEFHDLLVLARRLLATREDARAELHARYTRLLLDEFQDTDPIQLEIAVRLAAAPHGQGADWTALRPLPGRLFVVGDPKQSIYRFRRADIAVYLGAAARIGADHEVLSANFRSTDAVIGWVNGVFADVIRPEPDVQPAFVALDACRPGRRDHGTVTVMGAEVHGDEPRAEALREREAADVAAAVTTALHEGWPVTDELTGDLRPCRPGDIAVLLPARTLLPLLELALRAVEVPYRAENASVVYVAPEIRALLLALRAADDPTDQLALVAALRSPLYGCSDVELHDWRSAGGRWNVWTPAPEGHGDDPVAVAIAHVRSLAERIGRDAPADLLAAIVDERRVLEAALAGPDARDVWRRVRYVVDQARAWTDAGGRGVRRYLAWARHQAAEGRASDTILPEHDHDAVRIMTVHAAKGLEFPITVLAGLTTRVQRAPSLSVVWPDGTWALAERDSEPFEAFRPIDEQMGDAERRRLLYVACTRAVDHLVVSLHRAAERTDDGTSKATSATVLAAAGAAEHGARPLAGDAVVIARRAEAPAELPWADLADWAAERERALTTAGLRTATSATRLAEEVAALEAGADPALAKDAVDLDLPPWQRGRYGTAIGRAVHGVLQDADLATGDDVDALAANQCAAEGIFGMEPTVAALARSALAAPIVVAAAAGAPHWRELFVVADLGGRVLEGYVDLLVRTADGLVVVDYKTDQWRSDADRAARVARYRPQLCAYGAALAQLLDEPVVGGLLVRCRPAGPAEELPIPDWAAGVAAVRTFSSRSAATSGRESR